METIDDCMSNECKFEKKDFKIKKHSIGNDKLNGTDKVCLDKQFES